MSNKKKIIRTNVGRVYTSKFGSTLIEEELCLDGNTFAEAIDRIKELQEKYETSEYSNIRFDLYYDFSEDNRKIFLMGDREETDEEFEKRLADEAKQKENQRLRDERDLAAIAARLGKTVV